MFFRRSKYNAQPTIIDGHRFMSKREGQRYQALKILERGGIIRDLELQPRFALIVNGLKVCTYIADFRYTDVAKGEQVVEDVKGVLTDVYKIKKKLMQAVLGLEIQEV